VWTQFETRPTRTTIQDMEKTKDVSFYAMKVRATTRRTRRRNGITLAAGIEIGACRPGKLKNTKISAVKSSSVSGAGFGFLKILERDVPSGLSFNNCTGS